MSRDRRVALATCREFPDLDHEDRLLIPALAELGIEAVPAVWTDDSVDWSSFDAVVLRETWDYSDDRDAFLAWVDHVGSASVLLNHPELVRWNTDKRYLEELEAAGVPVTPTRFLKPGDDPTAWHPHGHVEGDVVVKPAVSCGSRDTLRHRAPDDEAEIVGQVRALLEDGRVVMVQPYLDSVDDAGETALLYFDGVFSHAIRKGPLLARGVEGERVEGLFVQEQIDPRTPGEDEIRIAERVIAAIPGQTPLYARVDLIRDAQGSPVVLEVELTEPSLFLSHSSGAADRLAQAIVRHLV
jgi:glutathione synthase/RimK-type ligase-like ATP-grasp enzyme